MSLEKAIQKLTTAVTSQTSITDQGIQPKQQTGGWSYLGKCGNALPIGSDIPAGACCFEKTIRGECRVRCNWGGGNPPFTERTHQGPCPREGLWTPVW